MFVALTIALYLYLMGMVVYATLYFKVNEIDDKRDVLCLTVGLLIWPILPPLSLAWGIVEWMAERRRINKLKKNKNKNRK